MGVMKNSFDYIKSSNNVAGDSNSCKRGYMKIRFVLKFRFPPLRHINPANDSVLT